MYPASYYMALYNITFASDSTIDLPLSSNKFENYDMY